MSDETFDRLKAGIESAVADDEIVTGWTVIIETYDSEGNKGIWCTANEEAAPWDIKGWLDYSYDALTGEYVANKIREVLAGYSDDDDE